MLVAVNGKTGIRMRLEMPRVGAWHADLKVDTADAITGAVTVVVGDGVMTLKGTVMRGGVYAEAADIRIVGGAGGLHQLARPRHYNNPQVRSILGHLLGDAGETLSSTVSASLLGRQLAAWTTAALPGGALLSRLCATLGGGITWRILADGTVWLGVETWPDSGLREIDDYQVIHEAPEASAATIGVVSPNMLPGTKLGDRRVSRVHSTVDETVRTIVLFEDAGDTTDRTLDAWQGALGGAVVDTFYRASYIGTLVQQEDDTIDVRFSDARLPSMAKVPIFGGVPGMRTDGATGGRVVVSWGAADPSQPKCEAFDSSTTARNLKLLASDVALIGVEARAQFAALGQTLQTIVTAVKTHTHAVAAAPGTAAPSVELAAVVDWNVTASNVKVS